MKKSVSIVSLCGVVLTIGIVTAPRMAAQPPVMDARVQTISRQIALNPTSPALRRALAERYEEMGLYQQASDAYFREASVRRQMGTPDLSVVVATEEKARRYATDVRLFQERIATPEERRRLNTNARLEPATGCYVGAFIDRDDALKETYMDENFQTHRYAREFSGVTQRLHSSYFMYLAYRSYMIDGVKKEQVMPLKWLQQCKDDGIIPQIALEPHDFSEVRDDDYLKNFAKTLGRLDWPIFVRFASEMNGKWTSWSSDPATYKAKFRLVNQVLHRYAPKVATIWCPNCVPVSTITDYYPGDDGCDWVGVNLYCVPFYNNDPLQPASKDAPTTLIDPVYNLYAGRKPMAIGEWGASRETRLQGTPREVDDFGKEKMALFYDALPRLYPRVKMVNWFDMNAIQHAAPGRQLNNYNLTEKPSFLTSYQAAIQEPYFIKSLSDMSNPLRPMPFPLKVGQVWDQPVSLSIWVKSYVSKPRVTLDIGGKNVYSGRSFGVHRMTVDPQQLAVGPQRVVVRVYDDNSRLITTESTFVEVRRGATMAVLPAPPAPTLTPLPRVVPASTPTPTPLPHVAPIPTPTPTPHPAIVPTPTPHPAPHLVVVSTPTPRPTPRFQLPKPHSKPKRTVRPAKPTLSDLLNQIKGRLQHPNALPNKPKTPPVASSASVLSVPDVSIPSPKPAPAPAKPSLSDWMKQGQSLLDKLKKKPAPNLAVPLAPMGESPFAAASLAATPSSVAVPVPISGIVKRYYANDVGLVTAMQVQTAGSQEVIFFPPAMAAQLTEADPVGTRIEAWLQPRAARGAAGERTWDLVALGFDKPVANSLKLTLKDGAALLAQWKAQNAKSHLTVRGKITTVVHDMAGRAFALVIDDKSLVYVPLTLRPLAAPKSAHTNVPTTPGLSVEVVGNGVTPPPGTRNLYGTIVQAQTIRTQGRALTGPEWVAIDRLSWKPTTQMAELAEGLQQDLVRVLNLQLFAGTLEDIMVKGNKPGAHPPSANGKLSAHPVPEEIVTGTGKRPW